ncbi:MAG: hypothetical protein DMG19_20380, partial [Acidobacteria bacterium]
RSACRRGTRHRSWRRISLRTEVLFCLRQRTTS